MKKVLIAYVSRTGKTEAMANFIAEGLRISGQEVDLKKISAIEDEKSITGYDGYVFGCPTYHKDMTGGMKQFLFKAEKANLTGKVGGAFRFPHPQRRKCAHDLRHHGACLQDGYDRPGAPEPHRSRGRQRRWDEGRPRLRQGARQETRIVNRLTGTAAGRKLSCGRPH